MILFRFLRIRPNQTQIVRFAVSFLLAALLWGWVTQLQDPYTTKRFSAIPVETAELPASLQIVSSLPEVTVTLRAASSRVEAIDRGDVAVRVDTSGIEKPGTYRVPLIVDSPDVNRRSVQPDEVSIQVDDLVSTVFPLTIDTIVEGDQARAVGTVTPDVSQVTVAGPSSAVDRIASIVLPVSLGQQVDDFDGVFSPYAADSTGQPITEVDILPSEISTRVEIRTRGKSVSVIPNTTGVPAEGYSIEQRRAVPDTIVVDGPPEVVNDVLFVNTEAVDVTDASQSFSTRVGLVDLPEGVTVIDPSGGNIEVRIAISNATRTSQTLPGLEVGQVGLGSGLEAEVIPTQVSLQVSAPIEILQEMGAEDITVFVRLAGLGPGTYTLRPEVVVPQGATWLGTEPSEVTVVIRRLGTPVPTPGSTPSATPG